MSASIPAGTVIAFLLALVRASSWLVLAPPFNNRAIPPLVKVGIAAGLALAVAPTISPSGGVAAGGLDTGAFLGSVVMQAGTGLLLGYLTSLTFAAVAAAGSLIDLFAGFTMTAALDPMSLDQEPVIGRSFNLVATTLLFAMDAHVVLLRGFVTSFKAVPITMPTLHQLSSTIAADTGWFFLSALEIAAPLVAVLFLTDVALGLLSRAAPQLNIFSLGLGIKTLAVLVLVGTTLPLLPGAVTSLVGRGVGDGLHVLGMRG